MSPGSMAVAAVASLLALAGFLALTTNTSSSYIPTVSEVSAKSDNLMITPGGSTSMLSIYASKQSLPITHISATVEYTSLDCEYFNLEFPYVTEIHPLVPGGSVSQKIMWVGPGGFGPDIIISGTLSDGEKFSLETNIIWIP
jgi:hypothetical protein